MHCHPSFKRSDHFVSILENKTITLIYSGDLCQADCSFASYNRPSLFPYKEQLLVGGSLSFFLVQVSSKQLVNHL